MCFPVAAIPVGANLRESLRTQVSVRDRADNRAEQQAGLHAAHGTLYLLGHPPDLDAGKAATDPNVDSVLMSRLSSAITKIRNAADNAITQTERRARATKAAAKRAAAAAELDAQRKVSAPLPSHEC